MSKSVKCCKCGKRTDVYNWFNLSYAKPQYNFDDLNRNVSRFCICHGCTDKLAIFLKASRGFDSEYCLQ